MDLADIVVSTHIPNRMGSIFGFGQLMMETAITLKLKLCQPHIFLRPAVGRTASWISASPAGAGLVRRRQGNLIFALDQEIEVRLKSQAVVMNCGAGIAAGLSLPVFQEMKT